ncbi:MAG: glucoamylase family protein, partial [Gemmatimonadaceae bacterium]
AQVGGPASGDWSRGWQLGVTALPIIALWMLSPAVAHALSAPAVRHEHRLDPTSRAEVVRYAHAHWQFFERFVNAETQWLAPDNYQELPVPVVAMRTSPTNIGLQLLATVSAYDLGLLSIHAVIERLEHAFRSLERMRRFRGHFYNWYDLRDLRVLEPAYVSTVDSGNLAGALIALRQACLAIPDDPISDAGALETLVPGEKTAHLAARTQRGRDGELLTSLPSWRELAARSTAASVVVARLEALANRAYEYVMEMDFRFLFDEKRQLFAIGYQQTSHTLDSSYYDLLASEARLASFVAIAKNDVPVEHWFRLGRTLTHAAGETALVSWSGSMFEYLMPLLVMRSFPFTVLHQTYEAAVRRHVAYGAERGVPWGVSESAFNLRDRFHTYQYRAFGVPDLALKRGLGRDLVIAPYASALAVMVDTRQALANLRQLETLGALGEYGFRDALDYTRPDPEQPYAVVRTYMAHHIGMGFVALANALSARLWQRRFHADALVRSAELLLHERIPRRLVMQEPQAADAAEALPDPDRERPAVREVDTPDTPQPHVALLGHLPYTIMVTSSGAGHSRYEGLAVTRWRADGTRDDYGQFCYLRDVATRSLWSAGHQPVCAPADWYRALLATDRVTIHRSDGDIETRTEVTAVPEDAAEVRRVTVTNNGDRTRDIELTSYGEVVLAPPDADRVHPAFANLFVETEWHEWCEAITATRRPRSAAERPLWCVHVVDAGSQRVGAATCETDRKRFLGRGRSMRNPAALDRDGALSGTTGAVLDPIVAVRVRVRVAPGQSASVAFTTLVAPSIARALELADRYHDPSAAQRALDLAWSRAQIELRELNISPADASVYQELAGHLFFSNPALRVPEKELRLNHGSQPLLWGMGLSGDWPILVATIRSPEGLPTLRQLLSAHQYWRRRGMMVDLVVLNEKPPSYLQQLNDQITGAVFSSTEAGTIDRPGGVFLRRADLLRDEELSMLRATARVHVLCDGRSLSRIVGAARVPGEESSPEQEGPVLRPSGRSTPPSMLTVQRVRARAASVLGIGAEARRSSRVPRSQPRPDGAADAGGD